MIILMPGNPEQWANSRNDELGLVSSYINNGTDGWGTIVWLWQYQIRSQPWYKTQ